jgi:hypothetical protein
MPRALISLPAIILLNNLSTVWKRINYGLKRENSSVHLCLKAVSKILNLNFIKDSISPPIII